VDPEVSNGFGYSIQVGKLSIAIVEDLNAAFLKKEFSF
jgi:hypothetical protein